MFDHDYGRILRDIAPGNVHIAGGSVRDILLKAKSHDLDFTVVGDACQVAQEFARITGGECTVHDRFGTATVRLGPARLDLVTARSEYYTSPGALPTVRPGTLADDLQRRDFTVNAMAMSLDDGSIIDPHGGQADIKVRTIRTLNERSFIDDPTRMLRAARYEQRLGFALDPVTEFHVMKAVAENAFAPVSGDRIRHELDRTTNEQHPLPVFRRMQQMGLFRAIQPGWNPDLDNIPENWHPAPLGWLAVSTRNCSPDTKDAVISRLNMTREQAKTMRAAWQLLQTMPDITETTTPAAACRRLEPLEGALETIDAATLFPEAAGTVTRYLSEWKQVRPVLTAKDLMEMGIHQGPALSSVLGSLQDLRLNRPHATKGDEEALFRTHLGSIP